jgi:hypothetical protein
MTHHKKGNSMKRTLRFFALAAGALAILTSPAGATATDYVHGPACSDITVTSFAASYPTLVNVGGTAVPDRSKIVLSADIAGGPDGTPKPMCAPNAKYRISEVVTFLWQVQGDGTLHEGTTTSSISRTAAANQIEMHFSATIDNPSPTDGPAACLAATSTYNIGTYSWTADSAPEAPGCIVVDPDIPPGGHYI